MAWRKEMTKNYVAGTLRELAGLPPTFVPPTDDDSAPGRLFAYSPMGPSHKWIKNAITMLLIWAMSSF